MVWALVVIWVVGGVLFGFMVWAGAVGAVGVLSRLGSWSASDRQNRKEGGADLSRGQRPAGFTWSMPSGPPLGICMRSMVRMPVRTAGREPRRVKVDPKLSIEKPTRG
jgi:hypothetical protein